ncbi:MAG: hypothetical protein NT167_32060 [Verrucomicrobia bacterium]|nr:hypothetical protein [Verrucomicrobiota bacterium]
MSDKNKEAEVKLQELARRINLGATVVNPVTESELQGVRDAVKKQWEFEHAIDQRVAKAKAAEQVRATQKKSQSQESGQTNTKKSKQQSDEHGHGHSH